MNFAILPSKASSLQCDKYHVHYVVISQSPCLMTSATYSSITDIARVFLPLTRVYDTIVKGYRSYAVKVSNRIK